MFLKITGCIFVFTAILSVSLLKSSCYKKRLVQLNELKHLLKALQNNLTFGNMVLEDAFVSLCEISSYGTQRLFKYALENLENEDAKPVKTIWEEALYKAEKELFLEKDDIQILKGLGKMLGKTDIEGQVENIKTITAQLDMQIKEAEQKKEQNAPVVLKLGILTGAAFIIVII